MTERPESLEELRSDDAPVAAPVDRSSALLISSPDRAGRRSKALPVCDHSEFETAGKSTVNGVIRHTSGGPRANSVGDPICSGTRVRTYFARLRLLVLFQNLIHARL